MAIFSKLIIGSAILSSIVLAAPFHGKKEYQPKAKWTVTETDYTTIDMTTTIYIDDGKTMSVSVKPTSVHHSTTTTALVKTTTSTTAAAPSTTMITSTTTTPIPSPATFYTTTRTTTPPATTPAATTSTPAMTTPAPAPTTSTPPPALAPATTAALAKSGGTGAPSSASDSASCQGEGAACSGDITYYGGGLGACGTNVDPTGNGIALPYEFMGTLSNSNPYCGKTLTIYNPATGKTAQATVMDKCMGCTGRSIDLAPAVFDILTNSDEGLGRVHNVDWWFN